MKRLALILAAVLLVAACSTGKDAVSQGSSFQFVAPGGQTDITYPPGQRQKIPNLSGEDLMDPKIRRAVADYPGKVVVINLWGQWCPPCRVEAPEMEKVHQQGKPIGVEVLGLDVRDENRQAAQDFVRDRGLTYPSIYDPPGRSLLPLSGYPRNAVPSTIVVDKQQRVAAVYLRDLLAADLLPVVQRLAAES